MYEIIVELTKYIYDVAGMLIDTIVLGMEG
jgi:hypothetical protein